MILNTFSFTWIRFSVPKISSSKEKINFQSRTRLNSRLKLGKFRIYNLEHNDFLSTSERWLEARNFVLENAFSFTSISLPYSNLSLTPRFTYPKLETSDRRDSWRSIPTRSTRSEKMRIASPYINSASLESLHLPKQK